MANDLTANPYIIDTAATITEGLIHINRITWKEPGTEGDDLTLTDGADNVIEDVNALNVGTGAEMDKELNQMFTGLKVSVIDAGTLYVYYG